MSTWMMRSWVLLFFLSSVLSDIENMPEFDSIEDEIDCPEGGDLTMLPVIQIPWNTPYRAHMTVPPEMLLKDSGIPEAGLGIFSRTFIKRYTWLGEYEGEVIKHLKEISDYAWKVKRDGKAYFYVDAYDPATSNWVRWINCSRHAREESVQVFECKGKMYYLTIKDLYPGQELFIYYGDGYAGDLDIDIKNYNNMDIYLNDRTQTCDMVNEVSDKSP